MTFWRKLISNMKFWTYNKNISNCPICISRVLIWMGFSLFALIPECPHTHKVSRTDLKPSKYGQVIWGATFLFLLGTAVYASIDFRTSESFMEIIVLLQVVNLLLVRCSIYFNRKECYTTYKLLLYLIERRKLYGVRTALSNRFALNLRFTISLHTMIAFLYNISTLFQSIYRTPTLKNTIYAFGNYVTHMDAAFIVFVMVDALNIYLELLTSLYKTVEQTLKSPNWKNGNLSFKLKIWQQYYLAIVNNFNRNILAPSSIIIVIAEFSFVILLIAFGFIHYVLKPQEEYDLSVFVDCTLFIYLSFHVNFLADNVMKSADNFISFLHRYPISRLGTQEASQVEMFLLMVNLHKPKLNASNVMTIGAQLIRTMLRNIVTYVLVLLQYKFLFQSSQ